MTVTVGPAEPVTLHIQFGVANVSSAIQLLELKEAWPCT